MKIKLLYFQDCPSWQTGAANLNAAMRLEGLTGSVQLIEVQNDEYAQPRRFLGSPSFQFGSVDLWPQNRPQYAMSCRIYQTPDGMRGWPTGEMFRGRLRSLTRGKP